MSSEVTMRDARAIPTDADATPATGTMETAKPTPAPR
jgi:hypothetical protein